MIRNKHSNKTPGRIVHSIASGIKKSTKIFKKGSSGRGGGRNELPTATGTSVRTSKRYGTFRSGRRRRRRRKQRKLEESGSFSSPERQSFNPPLSARSRNDESRESHSSSQASSRQSIISLVVVEDVQSRVLRKFDHGMRRILSHFAFFIFGVYQPTTFINLEVVLQIGHYILIIWGTCVLLRVMTYYAALHEKDLTVVEEADMIFSDDDRERLKSDDDIEDQPLLESTIFGLNDVQSPKSTFSRGSMFREDKRRNHLTCDTRNKIESSPEKGAIDESGHSVGSENDSGEQSWSHADIIANSDPPQHHPELEDLFLINKVSNKRAYPNGEPIPIESDLFSGHILFMFRTSDADKKEAPIQTGGTARCNEISDYFRTKKRRFEMQLQFKFKKAPDSQLYLSCDLEEPIKLGLVQRAFMKATMNFCKKKNPSLSYCLSGQDKVSEEDRKAGRYESPHMAFPVESTLDRLVITKPGEQPPRLGDEVHEDPELIVERKKGSGIDYNTHDTYTWCIWSAYIDFLSWKCVNLPAIRPFSIANVNGAQPVSLRFYTLNSSAGGHLKCEMNIAGDFEIGQRKTTSLGLGTKAWIESRTQDSINDPIPNNAGDLKENNDYDYDVLSSDGDVEVVARGIDEGPSDSDLDVLDDTDDEIYMKGSDTVSQNGNEMHFNISSELHYTNVHNYNIDTPAWIEMLHRTRKKSQRVYVIRIVKENNLEVLSDQEFDTKFDSEQLSSLLRLRTGKQLSSLLRLGSELGIQMSKSEDPKNFNDDLPYVPQINRKAAKRRGRSQSDHHVAVNKTLKQTIKRKSPSNRKSKMKSLKTASVSIAGEMTPPDQSCRTISHIFANLLKASKSMEKVSQSLSLQLSPVYELDSWFLRGSVAKLGVVPLLSSKNEKPRGEFIIARCLWESHWREEACIIYENRIEFYAPMTKKPCCITSLYDVQEIRLIETCDERDPIVLPKLAIETHWKCHYLVFCDDEKRSSFYNILNSTIYSNSTGMQQDDEWQAHFWQGFQHLNSLSGSSGKWTKITSNKKYHHRVVLNNRRMAFDCKGLSEPVFSVRDIGEFVEDLLRTALSFSMESLETSPDEFVNFQDRTSRLKNLPLQKLDRSGKDAFCICINLYHCLLQHSLLLSSSAPTKKSIVPLMRTHCYEIGGDVFSLAELECCVIRGSMTKPTYYKAPFVREPKKSRTHYMYALEIVDPRINFVLNTGDTSKPRQVPILSPDIVEEQMVSISKQFLRNNCTIDISKKTITLPKICEVYKSDFGSDTRSIYQYFSQFMDGDNQAAWIAITQGVHGNLSMKFEPSPDKFYSILSLLD